MSFLNQLNQQAQSLQSQQGAQTQNLEALAAASELVCKTVWSDFAELPRQLNVIEPAATALSLGGAVVGHEADRLPFRCAQEDAARQGGV